jgi:hypothetical protein
VLAMQNHGHTVLSPATDIFQPVVQNGLNWLFDKAIQRDLTPCNEGGMNPCIGVPAPVNTGLSAPMDGLDGYATGIFAAAIGSAAAVAPTRTVAAGLGSCKLEVCRGQDLCGSPAAPHKFLVLGPGRRSYALTAGTTTCRRATGRTARRWAGRFSVWRTPGRPERRFPPR